MDLQPGLLRLLRLDQILSLERLAKCAYQLCSPLLLQCLSGQDRMARTVQQIGPLGDPRIEDPDRMLTMEPATAHRVDDAEAAPTQLVAMTGSPYREQYAMTGRYPTMLIEPIRVAWVLPLRSSV